jgi:arsenite methyltransferase
MSRDLMHTAEINELFRDAYHHVSLTAAVVAHKLFQRRGAGAGSASAIDRALGVANHLRHATLRSGDTVLDLRCRGDVDSILAAYRTGSAGGVRLLA